jgi:site-specific recombinase XerD
MGNQAVGHLTLDNFAAINSLESLVKGYILSCRCEGKSPKTVTVYGDVLRNFLWYCRQKGYPDGPEKITTSHIRDFLWYLASQPNRWGSNNEAAQRPASQATVNHYYRTLRTFFNWLQREELIIDNPLEHIEAPKIDKKVILALTPEEVVRLLNGCTAKTVKDVRNRAILMLFLDCGLRVAELADIKLDDLDVDTGTIVIRRGKGGKGRVVHIGNKAQKALWRYLSIYRRGNSDSLFLGAGGQQLNKVGLQTMIARLGARTEVKVHPHKLRHTFAISYLRNGGDIFSLKYLLGHSSLAMVEHYLQSLNAEDAANAHKRFSPMDNM